MQDPVVISLCALTVAIIISVIYYNDRVDASIGRDAITPISSTTMTSSSLAVKPQSFGVLAIGAAANNDADSTADNEPEPDPYEFHEFIEQPNYAGHIQPVAPEQPTAADIEAQAEDQAEREERDLKDRETLQLQSQAEAERAKTNRAAVAIAHSEQARPDGGACPVDSSLNRPAAWTALPSEWRSKVGNPDISVISYDKNPQQRFVMSGGALVREGGALANTAKLAAVTASNRIVIQSSGCWVELTATDVSR